eukprot:tig00021126_g18476.t1
MGCGASGSYADFSKPAADYQKPPSLAPVRVHPEPPAKPTKAPQEKPSSESKPPSAAVVLVPIEADSQREGSRRAAPADGVRADKPSKPNSKHATAPQAAEAAAAQGPPPAAAAAASSARRTPSVSAAAGPAPQQQPPEPAKPKKPESFSMAPPRHARRLRRPGPVPSAPEAAPAPAPPRPSGRPRSAGQRGDRAADFAGAGGAGGVQHPRLPHAGPRQSRPSGPAAPRPLSSRWRLRLRLRRPPPDPAGPRPGGDAGPGRRRGLLGGGLGRGRERAADRAALERGLAADAAPLAAAFADPAALAAERRAVLFFVSSFGDGEPPESAQRLWAWLCDPARPANALAGLLFGLFGNGSRVYDQYQRFPRQLFARLRALGAVPLYARGEANEATMEADFAAWAGGLWGALADPKPVPPEAAGDPEEEPVLEWELEAAGPGAPLEAPLDEARRLQASALQPGEELLAARVLENRELHGPASPDSTRHVALSLPPAPAAAYRCGWYLGVVPEAPAGAVEALAARLGLPPSLLDEPRAHAAALADAKAFAAWRAAERRTPLEVLNEFASCAPASGSSSGRCRGAAVPLLHRLLPAVDPSTLAVAVKHVRYATASGAAHEGLCSAFLARLPVLGAAHVFVRRSRFEPPKDPATPLLMVATGSGVGPFLGFLQERSAGRGAGRGAGPAALVLGARSEAELLYRDELAELRGRARWPPCTPPSRGSRAPPAPTCSTASGRRPSPRGGRPRRRRGAVYVCGSGAGGMPEAVRAALAAALAAHGAAGSPAEGEALVARMRAEGRYKEDCW